MQPRADEPVVVGPTGPAAPVDEPIDFASWVDERQRSLIGFAQLVGGDRGGAEDLVQNALAKAYLKWSKIGSPGHHPEAYVRRIIVNEHASLWRRAWKRREYSTDRLPESKAADGVETDTTWALVQALPARQRAAIALRFYCDLSVAETAEAMGCSQGTVKAHTSRAIARLKTQLTAGDGDD